MQDLNALPLDQLYSTLVRGDSLSTLLELAKLEDLGDEGDITSNSIIHANQNAIAGVIARDIGVIAGQAVVEDIISTFEASVTYSTAVQDGDKVEVGTELGKLDGNLRDILAIERTLLNLLGRLCGIATLTRSYVQAILGAHAVICETRKTTPGLRTLEKYAVRCGGGTLHRIGLYDAVLIKDNHIAHIGNDKLTVELNEAARNARNNHQLRFVEVEVDSLEQLKQACACEKGLIDMVLLDNMPPEVLVEAVSMRNMSAEDIQLEASGGVTLDNVREIAETGVDRISIGALTHSAVSLDIGLDIETA